MIKEEVQTPKTYWYRFHIGSCPVCGRDKSYKERVYDESRPAEPNKRYIYLRDAETYDYCDAL